MKIPQKLLLGISLLACSDPDATPLIPLTQVTGQVVWDGEEPGDNQYLGLVWKDPNASAYTEQSAPALLVTHVQAYEPGTHQFQFDLDSFVPPAEVVASSSDLVGMGDFRLAKASIVLFQDIDDDGTLTLIDGDATASTDRIIGEASGAALLYVDGTVPDLDSMSCGEELCSDQLSDTMRTYLSFDYAATGYYLVPDWVEHDSWGDPACLPDGCTKTRSLASTPLPADLNVDVIAQGETQALARHACRSLGLSIPTIEYSMVNECVPDPQIDEFCIDEYATSQNAIEAGADVLCSDDGTSFTWRLYGETDGHVCIQPVHFQGYVINMTNVSEPTNWPCL